MSVRRWLPLVVLVIGCRAETNGPAILPDAGAESSSSSTCGRSIEGTACTNRGGMVMACSCGTDSVNLLCCNEYGIVRAKGCQDGWTRPTCRGGVFETGPYPDPPPGENGTTGRECIDDAMCDPLELGTSFCSATGFTSGSLYPTPTCFSVDCDAGDGSKIRSCDKDTGVCLATSSGGICLPACTFDDTGAPPKGCIGKNTCNAHGWSTEAPTGAVSGVGYCFGGCKADADCPTGNVCQVETALCVKTKVTFTKSPGEPCVKADSGSSTTPAKCNCRFTMTEGTGFCVSSCTFGEATCSAGFTCDPELPSKKLRDTDTVFTKAPTGLAGTCLKNCATDADCAGLNAYCDDSAGVTQKTCHLGKRPCVTDAHCPTGQTCSGATATANGRCE